MKCEKLAECTFYKEKKVNSRIEAIYQNYCEAERSQCARYLVSRTAGLEFVPSDLYPNMHKEAEQIINENFCDIESL